MEAWADGMDGKKAEKSKRRDRRGITEMDGWMDGWRN